MMTKIRLRVFLKKKEHEIGKANTYCNCNPKFVFDECTMIKMMGICQSAIGDQLEAGSAVISILQRLIVPWWPAAQFKGNVGKGNFKHNFGNGNIRWVSGHLVFICTHSHTCSSAFFELPRIPKDFQLLECLIASLLNAFWDKCREQCFQNSTCENKLTAERKQGFARKFTRFQHLHILSLIVRPMYLSEVLVGLSTQPFFNFCFQTKISPCIDLVPFCWKPNNH